MGRRFEEDGIDRRWVSAVVDGVSTTDLGEVSMRLLRSTDGRTCRWDRVGRAAGVGVDQVTAETQLWTLVDRGLVRVHERRTRTGEWEPYQWALTEVGLALVTPVPSPSPPVDRYLAGTDPEGHPVLASIRTWLSTGMSTSDLDTCLVLAIGEDLRKGRSPRGRLLSVVVGGHTKAVRLEDHREALEAAFGGFALEDVVRLHGRAVLAYGDFRFRVGCQAIDGRWSVPWSALTPETLRSMEELVVGARRVLTVENLVAFEEEVRGGVSTDTLVVYTAGFPGSMERAFLERVIAGGVERVDHWGDLDVGGLRIFRHLCQILPVPVSPWRMDVDTLDHLPTRSLTPRDREALGAWLADPTAPLHDLARVLLERGVKAEQEGWFLRG